MIFPFYGQGRLKRWQFSGALPNLGKDFPWISRQLRPTVKDIHQKSVGAAAVYRKKRSTTKMWGPDGAPFIRYIVVKHQSILGGWNDIHLSQLAPTRREGNVKQIDIFHTTTKKKMTEIFKKAVFRFEIPCSLLSLPSNFKGFKNQYIGETLSSRMAFSLL